MSKAPRDPALLNARYVAIRTAEARGLTERLLEAARDRTPGVRRMFAPLLFRYWRRRRAEGWTLIEKIAEGAVRGSGLLDRDALQLLGEISMPILNEVRGKPAELARLAEVWRKTLETLFGSPLARTARVVARGGVLKIVSNLLADVLKRQPIYQPVNYNELKTTFARPAAFRADWERLLGCLERPETAPAPIAEILGRAELPYDLYLMMISERALIYYGARIDPAALFDLAEELYWNGARWFRQSVLYVLFHVLSFREAVEDRCLERYDGLALDFFRSGSWRLTTAAGRYEMATMVANADVVAWRQRGGRAPKIVPELMDEAIAAGAADAIKALFAAIDGVAFYHGLGPLALEMLERAEVRGGKAVERQVIAGLATVRLMDQDGVESFLERHEGFGGTSAEEIATAEPSVAEEDLVTLLDGFIIHMMLTSDAFRGEICGAFRRALAAHTVPEFFAQLLAWVRDGLGARKRG